MSGKAVSYLHTFGVSFSLLLHLESSLTMLDTGCLLDWWFTSASSCPMSPFMPSKQHLCEVRPEEGFFFYKQCSLHHAQTSLTDLALHRISARSFTVLGFIFRSCQPFCLGKDMDQSSFPIIPATFVGDVGLFFFFFGLCVCTHTCAHACLCAQGTM